MTGRQSISTTKRLALFQAHNGVCHICGGKIQAGEAWDVEHLIPLAMGGADDPENWSPAHRKCHRTKTSQDVADIAKAKRREARHIGAQTSRNPLPGGRNTPWKRKIDGSVVRRGGV